MLKLLGYIVSHDIYDVANKINLRHNVIKTRILINNYFYIRIEQEFFLYNI